MGGSTSILATFATMKSLYDVNNHIDPYGILSEFIVDIVNTESLHVFFPVDMRDHLKRIFGFDVPESVVRTAAKRTNGLKLEKGTIVVDKSVINVNEAFREKCSLAEVEYTYVRDALFDFAMQDCGCSKFEMETLTRELVSYLLDDDFANSNPEYRNIIARFVLKHECDPEIMNVVNSIREGSILYLGLNNNIAETGSLKHTLTLYLDTEVLFNLYGLNGTIYQQLAKDLMFQIKRANTPEQKIKLRYFEEVEGEINRYFSTAEGIVQGSFDYTLDKPAMQNIVNGCSHVGDVVSKRSDFFHTLRAKYGIVADERQSYYDADDHAFNFEDAGMEDVKPEDLRQISHINVLRRGNIDRFILDAGHVIVTNTRSLLQASSEQSRGASGDEPGHAACDYAISVSRLTNILWYKLGGSFGQRAFPSNVDAIYKTRIVLSSAIAQNVVREFTETQKQYRDGDLTDEQLAGRILALKEKPITPDTITRDSIDDDLNFSSDFLARYERDREASKKAVAEKDQEIQRIKREVELIDEMRDAELAAKNSLLEASEEENKALRSELAQYKEQESANEEQRRRRRQIRQFVGRIALKLAVAAIITFCMIKTIQLLYPNESITLMVIIGIISGLITAGTAMLSVVKRDYQDIFNEAE